MQAALKRSLGVFWNGRAVGRYDLLEDGNELFAYDPSWLESADASPVSHSLPLRAEPYGSQGDERNDFCIARGEKMF